MYTKGQILDYRCGPRTTRKVVFIAMSRSGKRAQVRYIDRPLWDYCWVSPAKLVARDGAA